MEADMSQFEPGKVGTTVPFKKRYENFIGGCWTPPLAGAYFDNVSPVTGKAFCEVPRSGKDDIEAALDAAHAARDGWGRTSTAERANILNSIADRMEAKARKNKSLKSSP